MRIRKDGNGGKRRKATKTEREKIKQLAKNSGSAGNKPGPGYTASGPSPVGRRAVVIVITTARTPPFWNLFNCFQSKSDGSSPTHPSISFSFYFPSQTAHNAPGLRFDFARHGYGCAAKVSRKMREKASYGKILVAGIDKVA